MKETKLTDNEEMEKTDAFAVIKTEEIDSENVKVTIVHQRDTRFEHWFVLDGEKLKLVPPWEVNYPHVKIGSVDFIEYAQDTHGYVFFMKGCADIDKEASVIIPKEAWSYIKEGLEILGALIDIEEPKEDTSLAPIDYNTSTLTPTEEEINEMIDLVDIDTFNKIIKNRLYSYLAPSERELLGKVNRKWARSYLKEWAISKYRFYKMFGNKLSINKKIKLEPDITSIKTMVEEIKRKFPLYRFMLEKIKVEAFQTRRVSEVNVHRYFYEDKRVKSNMSITKFISLYGNKDLDTELSKMYQDIGKNTIYLSINPIDYLTVSINNSGWESCHNFFKGCYRNAGLSYMIDRTSFISFASRSNVPYPLEFPFEWNTKNWRQMVYMSEVDSKTVFSRQYPYDSEEISKKVREFFEEITSEYFKSANQWKVFTSERNAKVDVKRGDGSLVYNDVKEGFKYKVIKAKDDINYRENVQISIGNAVRALNDKDVFITASSDILYGREWSEDND